MCKLWLSGNCELILDSCVSTCLPSCSLSLSLSPVLSLPLHSLSLYQVEWAHTPQPIEVRLHSLRAVRDKLPRGQYSVSVALHSRLGGPALRWSRLRESQWAGTTEPVEHRGRFFDTELNINQSLYAVSIAQHSTAEKSSVQCHFPCPPLLTSLI